MNRGKLQHETMIPDLLREAPQVRPVLDRYGLRGCGGRLGPRESLGFFAGAHEVPLPRLLQELEAALEDADGTPESGPGVGDRIYRFFFLAGILVVSTLGAAWGAYLLLRIADSERFTAVGLHEVNAHGHAQIFGWVGLFVMGFAYQAFPRFKHTNLAFPYLAYASGFLMVGGLVVRSIGEPLVSSYPWVHSPVLAAAWIEVAAIALFLGILLATWRRSGKPPAFYDHYIAAGLFWFLAQAVYEAVYLAATLAADDKETLLALVARWQAPLREIQIHGFALLMILGVSQRMFHHFYGLPAPSERLSRWMLVVLNLAVAGEVFGLLLMSFQGHAWAALWYGSSVALGAAVVVLVLNWGIFSTPKERDRSLKFLRAAYLWLVVSLAMVVLLPVHQFGVLPAAAPESQASLSGFSHAYYGAVRHAITVGFVSLMIVGVAAKVVPTLVGVDVRRLSSLWAPFLLINLGCGLRVFGQILTDLTPQAFPVAGVSGCLEVAGLTLWGWHLARLMLFRGRVGEGTKETSLRPEEPILAEHHVGAVLACHPQLLTAFLEAGFKPLASSWMRRTVAEQVTIAQACSLLGVDSGALLTRLNREREGGAKAKVSLPVLT